MEIGWLRPCLAIVAICALLCVAANGRGLESAHSTNTGASHKAHKSASLGFQGHLSDRSCKFTCNSVESEGGSCEGSFKGSCSRNEMYTGINVTDLSKFECFGGWSGIEYSTVVGEKVTFDCKGLFGSTRLFTFPTGNATTGISLTQYGCGTFFDYLYEKTGDNSEEMVSCKGAQTLKSGMTSANTSDIQNSLDDFEQLLDEVSSDFDPFGSNVTRNDGSLSAGEKPVKASAPSVFVECNGKRPELRMACEGTKIIDIKFENGTISEECDGLWMPLGRVSSSCAGNYTLNSIGKTSTSNFGVFAKCDGKIEMGEGVERHGEYLFHEHGEVCIGFASVFENTTLLKASTGEQVDNTIFVT